MSDHERVPFEPSAQGEAAWAAFFIALNDESNQDRLDSLVISFFPTLHESTPEPFIQRLITVMRASFLSGYGMADKVARLTAEKELIDEWASNLDVDFAAQEGEGADD